MNMGLLAGLPRNEGGIHLGGKKGRCARAIIINFKVAKINHMAGI
jgi:hypothetical protein